MNGFSQLSDVNSSNGFNKNTWEAGQMKGRQREKERERGWVAEQVFIKRFLYIIYNPFF